MAFTLEFAEMWEDSDGLHITFDAGTLAEMAAKMEAMLPIIKAAATDTTKGE